ncbi:uridine diphosphate glucose pyrophosphatase NUDT22-like isoform X1 [Branchiostoma floridae x Branchiostoma belcheri]|nr:UDP-sugar diphosphatase [Branchiostoma belcheri]
MCTSVVMIPGRRRSSGGKLPVCRMTSSSTPNGTKGTTYYEDDFFMFLSCGARDGLPKSRVRVDFSSEKYGRKVEPSTEPNIARFWEDHKRNNPRLFNGSKFRMQSVDMLERDGEGNNLVTFRIGLTDYRDFMGTNMSRDAAYLMQRGRQSCGDPHAYLSQPVGVGSMVITSDDQVVMMRRSSWVSEGPGQLDRPGGHAEPKEVTKRCGSDEFTNDAVLDELFESVISEIRDEINIPESFLSEPRLLGVNGNHKSGGRPSVEFIVRCSLTAEEVQARYQAGGQAEADESTGLVMFKLQDMLRMDFLNPAVWRDLTPVARANVVMIRQGF